MQEKHRAQRKKLRAQSTGEEAQNAGHRAQRKKRRAQGTGHRGRSAGQKNGTRYAA